MPCILQSITVTSNNSSTLFNIHDIYKVTRFKRLVRLAKLNLPEHNFITLINLDKYNKNVYNYFFLFIMFSRYLSNQILTNP